MIKKRTIMLFPQFENMFLIDNLRHQYDPLAHKVAPHITLVFPFESTMAKKELDNILLTRFNTIKPFDIKLKGLEAVGSFLFLKITEGKEAIKEIHHVLYENEFSFFRPSWLGEYNPHMTVGAFKTEEEAHYALSMARDFKQSFRCNINKISVEIIDENECSIIEAVYRLK